MELFETINCFCRRNSGAVPREDRRRHSFMLKRLFSAQYPIQCNLVNHICSDPETASTVVSLLASRYTDVPQFIRMKVVQKKKKENLFKDYEDDVLNKYMEINGIGMRELEEAYEFDPKSVTEALKSIKKNFFDNKDKVIVKKITKHTEKDDKLF